MSEREFALVGHFFQDELALDSERPHGGLEGNLFVACLNCDRAEEQEGCDLPLLRLHGLTRAAAIAGLPLMVRFVAAFIPSCICESWAGSGCPIPRPPRPPCAPNPDSVTT
jgi:hypothetical protein